ncbi:syntaxin [Punctularia strigosozonata HHB-11173 SS5]|uniref:syntaxin n=1 Tax=Punctularia strigosozonata (strain HHB-11173) TaxID=741275 RepID=UPI0004416F5D|nr:syntaxin [Punctularia strigosozonata HHB-11173 SS5]EIN13683.1 syntaxin [Punctularia strigosozonata HHB-11173 SS5]
MTAIQAIYIRGHEERLEPKPHVVYRIEIQANVRSWQMWRRYSEFVDLHTELTKSTGSEPPAALPPKHVLSIFRSKDDPKLMEERRAGLETYLRAILSAKDDKWRESFAFRDFIGVPVGKGATDAGIAGGGSYSGQQFTSSSWLEEHADLQTGLRDIRAEINKRDALSDRGDVSGAHAANVQAKKRLAGVFSRVGALGKGLETLGMAGMAEGELRRRTDMVSRLQDECEALAKMVSVARNTSRMNAMTEPRQAPQSDRAALMGGTAGANKPRRVFGQPAPVQETEETRPLDDVGLLQLQRQKMDQQDEQVSGLSAILQRQKQLGLAISNEIREQISILEDLDNEVDQVGGKLTNAKRQLNQLG